MAVSFMPQSLPRYDPQQSYRWNYDHAPDAVPEVEAPGVPGEWTFCGLSVDSPLGMPAGPLLNGRWCLYYAALGFDVVTYKTVRSSARECYPLPNLVPVDVAQMSGSETSVGTLEEMDGSWAVSFGMPSMAPDVWRRDVEWTRERLPAGKLLSVSVVGTVQPGMTLEELADDYARCAKWAAESGADVIETNFSCPNVSTRDGQLFQQPAAAGLVAERVRAAIGSTPYIVKIGRVSTEADAAALLSAVDPHVNGIAMTNSIAARVVDGDTVLFDGQPRGICGAATREASVQQVALFKKLIAAADHPIDIIGVGGAATAGHVQAYLNAGASAVHIATAAMVDPLVGVTIRKNLRTSLTDM
jgi:dihydroorotate dehydrogenase (NAD+) catalytic subunit